MSTTTLSRITMETMANYRTAATQVVAASGAGSRRLVRAVDGTVQKQLMPRTARVAPRAAERLDEVRDSMSRLALQGIEQMVERSEQAIAAGSDFAVAQVARISDLAAEVEVKLVADGLQTAARLTLPAAQLALKVSGKVAEGATTLAGAAGAQPVKTAVRRGAAKAKTTAKTAARRTRKAVAQAVEAAPVQRARRAARKAA